MTTVRQTHKYVCADGNMVFMEEYNESHLHNNTYYWRYGVRHCGDDEAHVFSDLLRSKPTLQVKQLIREYGGMLGA